MLKYLALVAVVGFAVSFFKPLQVILGFIFGGLVDVVRLLCGRLPVIDFQMNCYSRVVGVRWEIDRAARPARHRRGVT